MSFPTAMFIYVNLIYYYSLFVAQIANNYFITQTNTPLQLLFGATI